MTEEEEEATMSAMTFSSGDAPPGEKEPSWEEENSSLESPSSEVMEEIIAETEWKPAREIVADVGRDEEDGDACRPDRECTR